MGILAIRWDSFMISEKLPDGNTVVDPNGKEAILNYEVLGLIKIWVIRLYLFR